MKKQQNNICHLHIICRPPSCTSSVLSFFIRQRIFFFWSINWTFCFLQCYVIYLQAQKLVLKTLSFFDFYENFTVYF